MNEQEFESVINRLTSTYLGTGKITCGWRDDENEDVAACCIRLSQTVMDTKETHIEKLGRNDICVYEFDGVVFIMLFGQPDSYWFKAEDMSKILAWGTKASGAV